MQIRFRFSADEKYWRLDSPRGRKFGVIDTPQKKIFLEFSPLYLRNASNDPNFFFIVAYSVQILVRLQSYK